MLSNPVTIASIENADTLRPAQLARALGVAPATIIRWIQSGLPMPDGTRIVLRAMRVGKFWRITRADADAFLSLTNGVQVEPQPSPATAPRPPMGKKTKKRLESILGPLE